MSSCFVNSLICNQHCSSTLELCTPSDVRNCLNIPVESGLVRMLTIIFRLAVYKSNFSLLIHFCDMEKFDVWFFHGILNFLRWLWQIYYLHLTGLNWFVIVQYPLIVSSIKGFDLPLQLLQQVLFMQIIELRNLVFLSSTRIIQFKCKAVTRGVSHVVWCFCPVIVWVSFKFEILCNGICVQSWLFFWCIWGLVLLQLDGSCVCNAWI